MQGLWGGELPAFDSTEDANELIGTLIMGLWNRLTRHQERSAPFRLVRTETKPTRQDLSALALMRRKRDLDPTFDDPGLSAIVQLLSRAGWTRVGYGAFAQI